MTDLGRFAPFVGSLTNNRMGGEEAFFTMLRSDKSLEIEAPLGSFSVDKILRWASLRRWASSPRPMTW